MKLLVPTGLLLTAALTAQPYATDDFLKLQKVLHKAMAKTAPSIVTIQTFGGTRKGEKRPTGKKPDQPRQPGRPGGRPPRPKLGMSGFAQAQGATAGIVLSEDGWILVSGFALNYNPTTILVTLSDGRTLTAKRKGEDKSRGIALVKVDAKDLPVAELVHKKDVKVGQWCFVLGRTFSSKDPSVHMGVVSAKDRVFGRAIQTDAYTSPANYGGPLIDVHGRVMGISVPMAPDGRKASENLYDSGIGFGATIADIQPLIERMKKGEILHRGYLRIKTNPAHMGPGAKLIDVTKGGPARNAGLRKGHIILEIDKVKVINNFHMQMLVSSKMVGDPVSLKYRKKNGEEVTVTVFLEQVTDNQMKPKTSDEPTDKLPWEEEEEEKKGGDGKEEDLKKSGDGDGGNKDGR